MSKEEVVKSIGYYSTKKGLKTLETFLMHEDIYAWVESGYRDSKYTAVEFLSKLCEVLDIDAARWSNELDKDRIFVQEAEKFRSTHISMNTTNPYTFPPGVSFDMDAFEGVRILERPYIVELVGRTDKEIFILISKIIKEHYADSDGRIFPWGDIVSYVYHHSDEKSYLFDIDGNQIENI
ncbi:hypothetical protein MN086_06340 [Sulfurovum sp. XGS-02]|uniref:hypothetical protein n=1 Tax=Sulfurovum sp. XGS-02 TaxID=2925411 RepID=UPI0020575D41|nr:hypothetical protein [Sulfurovum sp. XGS-02]UPT76671.1 hypothetical protein MN086_06340 [Sulfurovum sp. XGS-02]